MRAIGYNSVKSWAIVVCSGFILCMLTLPLRISSMLFVAFVDRYKTDRQNAAFFVTIFVILRSVLGPLTGFLSELFELRTLIVLGLLISCIGTGCCYWAENIWTVTICLGFIYGVGSVSVQLLPQVLKQHFNQNFANANGINNAVQCLLSFACLPLMAFVLNEYGVSGGLLIASAIMLHAIPVALLLWNPKYDDLRVIHTDTNSLPNGQEDTLEKVMLEKKNKVTADKTSLSTTDCIENIEPKLTENIQSKEQECDRIYDRNGKSIDSEEDTNEILLKTNDTSTQCEDNIKCNKYDSILENVELSDGLQTPSKKSKFRKAFETVFVMANPTYLIIMICISLHSFCVMFFYTICVDIVKDKGFAKGQEDFPLMVFILAEIFGHLCLGWILDKGYLRVTNYFSISFLITAVSFSCFGWSNNYYIIMVSAAALGLCNATILSAAPSLVYTFIKQEHQTVAITSRYILNTPLMFTMAPLIGYFRDTLGSYNGAMYLLTSICAGCAVMLFFLPFVAKCSNRKKS